MSTAIQIRSMQPEDWPAIKLIYEDGIATGNACFMSTPPESWEAWSHSRLPDCRLVACLEGQVVAWVALSAVSSRPVYRGVAEDSIYVKASARGKGVGDAIMQALISTSEAAGFWTLEALVFPENTASISLHQKYGFKLLCRREKMGLMSYGPYAGWWRDVALLERRSQLTGI